MTNPKTGAERIKANRDARRAAGLVEFRCWCTVDTRTALKGVLAAHKKLEAHWANAEASAGDV